MSNLFPLSGLVYCQHCKRPMRAQSGHKIRYYQDKTRIQHSGSCDQPMVKAEEVEEQVVRYLTSFHLPSNWRDEVLARAFSAEEMEAREQSRREIESRLARIADLYLEGDLDRDRYEQEKRICYDQLADLHPNGYSAIMKAGETLERFETLWSTGTALEKRNCCDVRSQQSSFGVSLCAQPSSRKHFTPLFHTVTVGTAGATGFEPAIFGLTGRHVNRYTTPPVTRRNIP